MNPEEFAVHDNSHQCDTPVIIINFKLLDKCDTQSDPTISKLLYSFENRPKLISKSV